MVNENALEVREASPFEVVENATAQAKLLMDIVEKTKCYQNISGKKYLQVEAWETIGAFNRTHAETESITPILRGEETIGYQARVQLWKDGVVVGGAIMPCYFTENCCKGKEGDAKHKSSMSAAQTFATSKAYRMNFAYVAILAGYQPLPAEEVTDDMTPDKTQHWCKEHDTAFFKRGKMKSYAHPIEGTDTWCHEHREKADADPKTGEIIEVKGEIVETGDDEKPPVVKTRQAPAEEAKEEEQQATASLIDLDWLKESIAKLVVKDPKAYSEDSMVKYMRSLFKDIEGTAIQGDTILDIASKLDKGQAKYLHDAIQDAMKKL